jgi:iron complex outermembrane receptor protein
MNYALRAHSTVLASAIALALSAGGAHAQTAASGGLEEITVTAERVSENLQDVPLSVTALSSTDLENRQIESGLDIVRQVPNLVGSNNVGLGSAASFFLRGVGQDESISTSDPAVGVYVDGVYISRQIANNVMLYDLERVEVLRGPQGTLYGRNTSGGAIKFETRKPSRDFGGYVNASYEFDHNRYTVDGSINVPFGENFAGKLTALGMKQSDGFQKSRTTGDEFWAPEAVGARGQLRWMPSDGIDLVLTGEYMKDEGEEIVGQDRLNDNPGTYASVLSGLRDQQQKVETTAVSLNGSFDLGWATLQSITGVRKLKQTFYIDVSDQAVPAYAIPNASTHDQWSQEFTLSGKGKRLDWLLGAFYMNEENRSFVGDELFLFGGFIAADFMRDLRNDSDSAAVFAHLTWHITDAFSITTAGRYTEEKKKVDVRQFIVMPGAIPGVTIDDYAPSRYPGKTGPLLPFWDTSAVKAAGTKTRPTFSNFDPKLSFEYKFAENALGYASFTKGFKSGGWNARVTNPDDFVLFKPESVKSYELGVKTTWLDNRVRANLTYFSAHYDDFIITAINPDTGNFITVNAAKMANDGVEGELAWNVIDPITLYANFGTNSARYTKSNSPDVSVDNYVKRTPAMTFAVGADGRFPVGPGNLIANIWFSSQGSYYADLANSEYAHVPKLELLDASVGYETAGGDWRFALSCKNCTDEESFHSALVFEALGFATQFPITPRQYFLSARYSFGGRN